MGIIEFDNVTKFYDSHLARSGGLKNYILNFAKRNEERESHLVLENLSFSIETGSCTAFVGRNGVGKSTLLSLIAGVLLPNSGKVTVRDRVSSLLELGAGFHADLTGRENIQLYGVLLGFTKKEIADRTDAIHDFSELDHYMDVPFRYYSSGMKARLGFSVVAQLDPRILLVDEVLGVGDFTFKEKCHHVMKKFKDEGKTIIIVSHSARDVTDFCDRALWINERKIVKDGDSTEVIRAYMGEKANV